MADLRKKLISSLVVSLSITALMASGLMQRPGKWRDDRVFQTPRAVPGDIVIIGIDEKAISEFGPYNTWDRSIMASAINELSKACCLASNMDPETSSREQLVAIYAVATRANIPVINDFLIPHIRF